MVQARGLEHPPLRFGDKMHQENADEILACILQRFRITPYPHIKTGNADALPVFMVRARGLDSRRCDAKPREFRLCYAPRSVAALTRHWRVIHYRSPSSPLVLNRTKKQGVLLHRLQREWKCTIPLFITGVFYRASPSLGVSFFCRKMSNFIEVINFL